MVSDISDLVVVDAAQVRPHVGRRGDPDEQGRIAGRVDADARGRVEGLDDHPALPRTSPRSIPSPVSAKVLVASRVVGDV